MTRANPYLQVSRSCEPAFVVSQIPIATKSLPPKEATFIIGSYSGPATSMVAAAGRSLHELATGAVALDAAPSQKNFGDHVREWIIVSYDVVLVVVQTCTIINHVLLMYAIQKVLWKRGSEPAPLENDPLLKGAPKASVWPPKGVP